MTEKETFTNTVCIIVDTREQQNTHIISEFEKFNIKYISSKLDFGDYSFNVDGIDFRNSCVIERKSSINELWSNITYDRERFERELQTIKNIVGKNILLLEECSSWDNLKSYKVQGYEMKYQNRKVENIGEVIHNTLKSYSCYNRYNLDVVFTDKSRTSSKILEIFYWYYHNYKSMVKPRKNTKLL